MKPHCRRTVLVEGQRYTGLSASSYTTPDRRSAETEPSALCSAVCSCFRLPSLPSRCKLRHPLDQSPVLRVPSFWTPLTQLPLHSATPSLCSPPAHSALEQSALRPVPRTLPANINVSSLQVQASGCMLGLLLLLFPALAIIQPGLTNHPPSLRCPVFKFTRVVCWLNFRQRPKALKRPESRVTLHGVFLQQQRRRLFRPRGCAPVWEPVAPSIGQLIRT